MTRKAKHTEPTQNSHAAAYGYKYMYDGFGGSAQASHGVSPRHTVTELGGSAWITDGTGNVNQYLAYMPFGESFIDQRSGNDIRFKFTGKERDAETGFDYFGARYYSSGLSVWLRVDPLSFLYSSTSPYNYVENNPIKYRVPNGMYKDPTDAQKAQEKALKRHGKGRVGEIYDANKGTDKTPNYKLQIYKKGEDKYTRINEKGEVVAYKPLVSVNNNRDLRNAKKYEETGEYRPCQALIWGYTNSSMKNLKVKIDDFSRKADGDTWGPKFRDNFEKTTVIVGRSLTSLLFPVFRVFNWAYTFSTFPNNRENEEKNKKKSE